MEFNIIYEENTELAEIEAFNKGYRGDVVVIIGEKRYKVYISSMIRLQQDFETEQRDSGYYMAEPNTLLGGKKNFYLKEISQCFFHFQYPSQRKSHSFLLMCSHADNSKCRYTRCNISF